MRRQIRDEGSATVWVLAIGLVLVTVATTLGAVGAATVAHQRAQAAADLAALGAALRVWDGEQAACDRAAQLSALNGAELVACRLDGLDAVVTVAVVASSLPGCGVAQASARAGPVEWSG